MDIPEYEMARWDGHKLLNDRRKPVWSGKEPPPAIGELVPVGKGMTVRVEGYKVDHGWLMIVGERSDGVRGDLAGAEIAYPKD